MREYLMHTIYHCITGFAELPSRLGIWYWFSGVHSPNKKGGIDLVAGRRVFKGTQNIIKRKIFLDKVFWPRELIAMTFYYPNRLFQKNRRRKASKPVPCFNYPVSAKNLISHSPKGHIIKTFCVPKRIRTNKRLFRFSYRQELFWDVVDFIFYHLFVNRKPIIWQGTGKPCVKLRLTIYVIDHYIIYKQLKPIMNSVFRITQIWLFLR